MSYEEVKKLSKEDAQMQAAQTRAHLQELRFKLGANQVKDVREVRTLRRRIAHLLTYLHVSNKSHTN